jgi:hypothetical protein
MLAKIAILVNVEVVNPARNVFLLRVAFPVMPASNVLLVMYAMLAKAQLIVLPVTLAKNVSPNNNAPDVMNVILVRFK